MLRGGGIAVKEPVEGAGDVVLPRHLLRRSDGADGELRRLHEVAGRELAAVVGRRRNGEERPLVDCRGEDVALVVVGVIAEDLDTPRGVRDDLRLLAIHLLELGYQLVVDFLVLHFNFSFLLTPDY